MKRGILKINKLEGAEALNSMPQNRENTPLYQKFKAVQNGSSDFVDVQVSEEELEILLDDIGIPVDGEPLEKQSLRTKVQSFLSELRSV